MNNTELQKIDYKQLFPWLHLFSAFRIAIDPRKLILAGLALVALAAGETAFSYLPFWDEGQIVIKTAGADSASIPLGTTLPWEHTLNTGFRPGHPQSLAEEVERLLLSPTETMLEIGSNWQVVLLPILDPLFSIVSLFEGDLSWERAAVAWTRLLWLLIVWAIFGGAITRIAAVQFARDQNIGLKPALQYSCKRFLSFLSAPLIAVSFLLFLWVICLIGGLIGRIPVVGDGLLGLFWIIPLLLGLVMAVVLIGGVPGWPLMYAAISTEDSDAFDGFSRSYSYVYSRPWRYLWNAVVAMTYGSVVIFFVFTIGSLIAYLAAWGISLGRGPEETSQLLQAVSGSFLDLKSFSLSSDQDLKFGGIMAMLWIHIWAILMHGFIYSYFWTAVTIIYFLLRQSEDAVELDVVALPEEQQSPEQLPLVGVAASEQPVVERPAKAEEEQEE